MMIAIKDGKKLSKKERTAVLRDCKACLEAFPERGWMDWWIEYMNTDDPHSERVYFSLAFSMMEGKEGLEAFRASHTCSDASLPPQQG